MDVIGSNTSEEQQDMSQEPVAFDGGTQCNDESKTENQVKEYPAAELIANTCKEEYMRLINTYDNIYNKVNILLVVCMAIFIAQAESFNGNALVKSIMSANTEIKVICLIMQLCFSAIALLLILGATVLLCLLLKSQKMPVLNCLDIRNQNVNEYKLENEANTLLVLYTNVIAEMNPIIEKKQKRYDLSVILVATSVVLFAIEKIM